METSVKAADCGNGAQRLSIERLKHWEQLQYGMFIHFGMSTYDGDELSRGDKPSTLYAPDKLDVEQWVSVARDAGMKYAVLTAKHVAGHCLWPSALTDYHVGTSGNKTDVVERFVNACRRQGILPGLYYCSWDNHHRFGSLTPSDFMGLNPTWKLECCSDIKDIYVTDEYYEFQAGQLKELLTGYGDIAEIWIDIPGMLSRTQRNKLYAQVTAWQPEAVVMMNHGIGDGSTFKVFYAWPTDLIAIERYLPNSHTGHVKWRNIEGRDYYMPGEVCDPIGRSWFYEANDMPRSDEELYGMFLTSISRGANLLLNVPPDRSGTIAPRYVDALMRLRHNLDRPLRH